MQNFMKLSEDDVGFLQFPMISDKASNKCKSDKLAHLSIEGEKMDRMLQERMILV